MLQGQLARLAEVKRQIRALQREEDLLVAEIKPYLQVGQKIEESDHTVGLERIYRLVAVDPLEAIPYLAAWGQDCWVEQPVSKDKLTVYGKKHGGVKFQDGRVFIEHEAVPGLSLVPQDRLMLRWKS